MSLTDNELSQVLHDIVPTPPAEPGRLESIRVRARRTQRRRRAAAVVGVVAAVAAVAAVPSGLFDRGGREPVLASGSLSDAPARGDLVHAPHIMAAAITAWVDAYDRAHRDSHLTGRLVFAGHVANEVVVVLSGIAPHGGDRWVVLEGPTVNELSLYADQSDVGRSSLRILLGKPAELPKGVDRFDCNRAPSTTVVERPLLALDTSTGTAEGRWKTVDDAQQGCPGHHLKADSAFTTFMIHDGVGITTIRSTADQSVQVFTPGMTGDPDITFASGVPQLPGGRVDTGAPIKALDPPVITESQASDGTGVTSSVSSGSGELVARAGDGKDRSPSPLGWQYRYDDSQGIDAYGPLVERIGGNSSGTQVLALAAPDGTQVGVAVARTAAEQRVGLVSVVDGKPQLLVNQPLDSSDVPKQLSAVYSGRDGKRWLFVAGAPGTYDIAYRAPGERTWVSSDDVYMSSTFIALADGDAGTGSIRLARQDGSVIYEGPLTSP